MKHSLGSWPDVSAHKTIDCAGWQIAVVSSATLQALSVPKQAAERRPNWIDRTLTILVKRARQSLPARRDTVLLCVTLYCVEFVEVAGYRPAALAAVTITLHSRQDWQLGVFFTH